MFFIALSFFTLSFRSLLRLRLNRFGPQLAFRENEYFFFPFMGQLHSSVAKLPQNAAQSVYEEWEVSDTMQL